MKRRERNNITIKNKGQALIELAIFGSILLFCVAALIQYGLQANYQQEAQMEVFRKAQKMAFYRDGPNSAVSLVLFKNKSIPDPRDQFGFAERITVPASESVVWDTDQSAQYVKKFPKESGKLKAFFESIFGSSSKDQPKEEDLPAVYFEIEGVNRKTSVNDKDNNPTGKKIKDVAKAAVSSGENNVFGFYTAKFEKRACPPELTVVFEDRKHTQGTEYIKEIVPKGEILLARLEGGFGNMEAETDSELLMYPYFIRKGSIMKQRITDADLDGDGHLESIIAADKGLNLFYIDSHDSVYDSSIPKGGEIQIDTAYAQIESGDKDVTTGQLLSPNDRQGLLQDFEKTIEHRESKIVKTKEAGVITSKTTLNAKQTIYHKFRLNDGQIVSIPIEFSTDPNKALYQWNQ